jgi:hypothetical protein
MLFAYVTNLVNWKSSWRGPKSVGGLRSFLDWSGCWAFAALPRAFSGWQKTSINQAIRIELLFGLGVFLFAVCITSNTRFVRTKDDTHYRILQFCSFRRMDYPPGPFSTRWAGCVESFATHLPAVEEELT